MVDAKEGRGARPARRGPRLRRHVLRGALALLAVAVATLYLVVRSAETRPFPRTSGRVEVAGLEERVEVIRDSRGIPHIYARTAHDLFLAQGYVHAQDRFWQMDFWRHIGSGRLSELFGESQVGTDAFLRTLGWRRVAEAQLRRTAAEDLAVLEAYSAGVNAYAGDRDPSALGLEYSVLGIRNRDYAPEPWEPADTVTWGLAMAWDLRGNMGEEIARAVLLGSLSREQVDQIYPPYPEGRNPTIVSGFERRLQDAPDPPEQPLARDALRRLSERVAALDALTGGGDGEGIGSNSWVVSAKRTPTGRPILANDPHLGIQMPSIWYQVGLHCEPVSESCSYDVVGFSFAGVPGVIIGHNARIAWGMTNLGPDVMDLYVERVDPDHPDRYEVDGRWEEMEVREETIEVARGEPVRVRVRETRHGPVVSEAFPPLRGFGEDAGIEVPDSYAVALRWTALEPSPSMVPAILGINRASRWEEFREALRSFTCPAQNYVYADVDGNIGYQAPGVIPIRARGDGRLPVPGWTSDHEWTGFIPFDELPSERNPERGYIVTANNAVVGEGYRHLLTKDWSYGYRARRIVDLIEERPTLGIAEHQQIQLDSYSLNAERLLPFLRRLDLEEGGGAEAVRSTIVGWDRRMERASAGAAAFAAFWRRLLELAFHDDLPADRRPYGGSRWFVVVDGLLDRPDDPLWDDRRTPEREERDDMLRRALAVAARDLAERFDGARERWRWGPLHTADFVHQTLGKSGIRVIEERFNRTGFEASGGTSLVLATGWNASEGFAVDWLPSMRMIVDLADLSRSVTIHTTGQSGHAGHRHYDDLIPLWLEGRYYPMLWRRDEVESDAEGTLVFSPAE